LDLVKIVQKKSSQPEIIPKNRFSKKEKDNFGGFVTYESYPALAIPIQTKHGYVCPESHIDELKETLRSVEKILIIGWKAADENLLEIFEEVIKHPVEFTIVAGQNSKSVKTTVERIQKKVKTATFVIVNKRFTDFMGGQESIDFFLS